MSAIPHQQQSLWLPSLGTVFRSLLVARLVSAFSMHVSDCDETFNYWEPTHYLLYGSGFQTWEYSPAYALRSYGYLLLHTVPLLITQRGNKVLTFYLLRIVLGAVCALAEFYFYRAVLERFGPRVARLTLFFQLLGAGMFVSATAFLPSSFAMYLGMVAMAAWFKNNFEVAIFAVAVSALVGWPFSAALGLPIAFHLIFIKKQFSHFVLWSLLCFAVVAVPLVAVDSYYYGKLVCAPLNILLYNMLGKGGPDLYGVAPMSYYFVNGFLNFNVVFVLALTAISLIDLQVFYEALVVALGLQPEAPTNWLRVARDTLKIHFGKVHTRSQHLRMASLPLLVWILVFFTRPHKEERFLFPVYPLFSLCAAIALSLLPEVASVYVGLLLVPFPLKRLTRPVKSLLFYLLSRLPAIVCVLYALLCVSRVTALYRGYHGSLDLYSRLNAGEVQQLTLPLREVNVCVGKEWHRFPSSFFLPAQHKWKLRFIRSEFKGQLPKPYSLQGNATSIVPENMNDMNREEPSRYFDIAQCHFLVDLDIASDSPLEPRYSEESHTWHLAMKFPFLHATRSHQLLRAFYVPWYSESHTTFSDYVLLLNKPLFELLKQRMSS